MKVIVDAYGGDKAPLEILKGTAQAVKEYGVQVVLCGKEKELRALAQEHHISMENIEIAPASTILPVEVEPSSIRGEYSDSSMAVGLKLLGKGGGDAFVSAGSTGGIVMGASMFVGRLKGIKRAAIGTLIPTTTGCYMLMDAGANAECRPEMLLQFGIMGSVYMEKVIGVKKPRVGLVNIGTEANKGLDLHIQSAHLLEQAPVHFIGNIEARQLPLGGCDVAVCDGFVGNVILKLTEGMGKLMSAEIKQVLLHNTLSKAAAILLRGGLSKLGKKMDYTEYGGAPLMGLAKPVIKAHGSSNAKAIKNAIRQAKIVHENQVIPVIQDALKAREG